MKLSVYWDDTYDTERVRLINVAQFTEANGWPVDERIYNKVLELEVGHSLLSDAGHIVITRVQ